MYLGSKQKTAWAWTKNVNLENVYFQTERIKNNHYTKNHVQELHDKKV